MSRRVPQSTSWLSVVTSFGRGGVQRNATSIAQGLGKTGRISHLLVSEEGSVYEVRSDGLAPVSALPAYDVLLLHNHGPKEHLLGAIDRFPATVILEFSIWGKPNEVSHLAHGTLHLSVEMRQKYEARNEQKPLPGLVTGNVVQDAFWTSPSRRMQGRELLGISPDQLVAGRVGQPHLESKWHTGLVECFLAAARRVPSSVLVLVGPHKSVRDAAVQTLDATQYRIIDWIDSDEQVISVLDAMDVYAHWSAQGETFGISVVEALARGLPIVTMRVDRGDNAHTELLAQAPSHPSHICRSPRQFTRALRRTLVHPDTTSASRGVLRDRYSQEVVTSSILKFADALSIGQ